MIRAPVLLAALAVAAPARAEIAPEVLDAAVATCVATVGSGGEMPFEGWVRAGTSGQGATLWDAPDGTARAEVRASPGAEGPRFACSVTDMAGASAGAVPLAAEAWRARAPDAWRIVGVPDIYSRAAARESQRAYAVCGAGPVALLVLFSPPGLHLGAPDALPWSATVSELGPRAPEFCGATQ